LYGLVLSKHAKENFYYYYFRSIKFFITLNVELFRPTELGPQFTDATLRTEVLIVSEGNDIDLNVVIEQLLSKLDDFNRRGSGWQLGLIKNCTVSTAKYRPLVGSSYIRTPSLIENRHAVVNVKNLNDNLCFVWSVLAHLHPAEHNPARVTNYEQYLHEINVTGLEFPLSIRHIPKFESLNPTICITVLAFDEDEKDFIPLYVSPILIDNTV
jgi:hypothetical protein